LPQILLALRERLKHILNIETPLKRLSSDHSHTKITFWRSGHFISMACKTPGDVPMAVGHRMMAVPACRGPVGRANFKASGGQFPGSVA
jgi:hypothetical protein